MVSKVQRGRSPPGALDGNADLVARAEGVARGIDLHAHRLECSSRHVLGVRFQVHLNEDRWRSIASRRPFGASTRPGFSGATLQPSWPLLVLGWAGVALMLTAWVARRRQVT